MANCTKCGSNEHIAANCPHGFFSNKCSHCGSVDHPSSACPHGFFSSKCGRCGSTEHSTSSCPHGFFSSRCKHCGSVDHATSNCPHGMFADHCANCGSKNHSTSQCPQRNLPSGMNGLIALAVIVALLLALFSAPFKIIDAQFSPFDFEWLSNRDVWLFCFASWMSLLLIFHVSSRVINNKNETAEVRFGNPFITLGFFTLFLSFVAAIFFYYRFKNDFRLFYLSFSTVLVTIVYLIFKKSTPRRMLGAIAMSWIIVIASMFYVFRYSDTFPIAGTQIITPPSEESVIVPPPKIIKDEEVTTEEKNEEIKEDLENSTKSIESDNNEQIVQAPIEEISKSVEMPEEDDENKVFTKVEVDASYVGAETAWRRYLSNNLDVSVAGENGAAPGVYTVIVRFIVAKDGSVSDVQAETNHGYGMEQESVRVIKKSGKWTPAIQNGRNVTAYKRQEITWVVQE